MRAASILSLLLVLLSGCASSVSSVAHRASCRYQRLSTWHRFTEAAFEYEYACANLELSKKFQRMPEPSLDVLLRNAPVWLDMELLMAWAEDKNVRMSRAAHDRLALLLDKRGSLSTAELTKYYRDNRNRLFYQGPHFILMPENSRVLPVLASWVSMRAVSSSICVRIPHLGLLKPSTKYIFSPTIMPR